MAVTQDMVRAYAAMFAIPLTEQELPELTAQLAGGFAAIAELWRVDVSGMEPSVTLPVDRM